MLTQRIVDHLVYAVPDLQTAMDDLEKLLGIRPNFGGYHTAKGTKNAVLNLGNGCYLEILAVDEENKEISSPRWMGVDLIDKPRMTRWCLKSNDLEKDSQTLKKYNPEMGEISGGQRKMSDGNLLAWSMIMPLAAPEVDLIPFMVDWRKSAIHPTEWMEDVCRLVALDFSHPHPEIINPILSEFSPNLIISKGKTARITAHINSPNGVVELR
ncbi:MAG: VOC family protein [Bacteroidetes bacterium]|nr:VOC family protein [Bacteroidota bacterium]